MAKASSNIFFSDFFIWIAFGLIGLYMLWPLRDSLRFGIDLVGGTYLTLEVQTEKAIEADLVGKLQSIDIILSDARVGKAKNKMVENGVLNISFDSIGQTQSAASILKKKWTNAIVSSDGNNVIVTLSDSVQARLQDEAVESNIEVLRSRLNPLSV